MFGRKSKDAAIESATETLTANIGAQLTVYMNMGILIDAIDSDAYIAGYINGKMVSFIAYSIKAEGLHQADANQVSGQVLLNFFGAENGRLVSSYLKRHTREATAKFQKGQHRGALVIAYAVGAQDVRSEPEYSNALEAIKPISELSGSEDIDDDMMAIGGLEELWFGSYMKAKI